MHRAPCHEAAQQPSAAPRVMGSAQRAVDEGKPVHEGVPRSRCACFEMARPATRPATPAKERHLPVAWTFGEPVDVGVLDHQRRLRAHDALGQRAHLGQGAAFQQSRDQPLPDQIRGDATLGCVEFDAPQETTTPHVTHQRVVGAHFA